jgi:carbon-monoxide dehydrogenase large subunit
MGAKWFGASVKRKEDPAFLTGKGRYVDDIKLPGMLYGYVLRSPHAHARFRTIDKSAALALPGVHAVYTFADMPESLQKQTIPLLVPSPAIKQVYMQHCLARDEACYVGEPIAIVVADSRYLAEDAAGLVDIDYEVLSAASDCSYRCDLESRRLHSDQRRRH